MGTETRKLLRRCRRLAANEFGSVEHVTRVEEFIRAVRSAGFICYVNLAGEVVIRERASRAVRRG